MDLEYKPEDCGFANMWHACINLLHIPMSVQNELRDKYNQSNGDTAKVKPPRIKIAKFHFPVEIVQLDRPTWLTPFTKEEAEELGCYRHIQPPPHKDGIMKFNPSLGNGQSKRMQKKRAGITQIRKVPCVTCKQATDIAAAAQNSSPTARLDLTSVREEHNLAAAHKQLADESRAAQERSVEDWTSMVSQKDAEICALQTENAFLKEDLQKLLLTISGKDEALNSAKAEIYKHHKRVERTQSSMDAEAEEAMRQEISNEVFLQVMDLLSRVGGLSRLTLFNDDWHEEHNDAAKLLFGYLSWKETKQYVQAFFPGEVEVYDPSKHIELDAKSKELTLPPLSSFERCLICRLFFRCFTLQPIHALIVDRHRTTIGKILKQWAPKWANVGEALSCLDVTADYLTKEVPDRNVDLGRPKMVFVDGKDCEIDPKRNDAALAKSTFSSKTNKDAARMLAFSTASGLVFEATRLFAARAGERELVKHLSSLGPVNAPVEEWEDVAVSQPWDSKVDDKFWTAMDDILNPTEMAELWNSIDVELDEVPSIINGLNDDGILLTGQSSGLHREGISDADIDSDVDSVSNEDDSQDEPGSDTTAGRDIYGINHALADFEMMMKCSAIEKQQRTTGKRKMPPVLSVATLKEQNERAIRSGPNSSGKFKCRQLEIHQRLHLLYESGVLSKCLLSYFLLVTESDRMKLLSWMGSPLASGTSKPTREQLPKIPLRLAKIPEDFDLGADKGFTNISWILPNLNWVETPFKLDNSKTQRKSSEQIEAEVPLTTCRAPSETIFRRWTYNASVQEPIPYWLLSLISHSHMVAFGDVNLLRPLRYPGRNAIVGPDYWDNKIDYTRVPQPTCPQIDVGISTRQKCMRCRQGGIVMICRTCSKFYHCNSQCHDFDNCTPTRVHNPYN